MSRAETTHIRKSGSPGADLRKFGAGLWRLYVVVKGLGGTSCVDGEVWVVEVASVEGIEGLWDGMTWRRRYMLSVCVSMCWKNEPQG